MEKVYQALERIKIECTTRRNCDGCPFYTGRECITDGTPEFWDIDKIKENEEG